ncbi:DUF4129 domain-containing protein [Catenuloplanes atrovinosus]|uniref:Protein-glutamine gamma-glutamyltransferase-like C-terminal domain-containing protein n=1 Tax=Catenuloplanes atrovinosus TaxID=137266 RepID=A0AAE4CCE4_9ACTN|nr:DUF4129 domain-containing protein [Catenuloplanes atrovinosus]MDR7279162.1 hypothetical protein [Catenuloplanes atrovinosus]
MTFSRWWTEMVGVVDDRVGAGIAMLIVLFTAFVVAIAWYAYPAWVPRRLPRLRLPRWRLRRRRRARPDAAEAIETVEIDTLPELPSNSLVTLADRYAADGRYAEAVRERHRAMVRELVEHHVIEHHPEWTVTELAGAAVRARPALDAPLRTAGTIFSDIWYGQHPAEPGHDQRMRELSTELGAALREGRR